MHLSILAQITASEGKADFVRAELEKLVPITRAEAGCVQYDLFVDNEKSGFFVFHETWETRELWQAHMNAPHLKAYIDATDGAVTQFIVNEMSKIA